MSTSLIAVRNLSVSFGATQVLDKIDFTVGAGELVGLIGPNGAGKTTLLRAMAGLLSPTGGTVVYDGMNIAPGDHKARARAVAYLPQSGEVHWAVSVEALVTMGRLPHMEMFGAGAQDDRRAVAAALAACDLGGFEDRPVTHLSGGEKARALLARALAVEPKVLLADEPVAGLDPAHQLEVMQKLCDLAGAGAGVVAVMHDLTHATRYCDRVAVLYDHAIAAEGVPGDVLTPEILAGCFGVRALHGDADGRPFIIPVERAIP